MAVGKSSTIILVIGLIVTLILSACSSSVTTSEDKKVVEVGCMAGITGPGGTESQWAFWALQEYQRYFNEENGIPDVDIELSWQDTRHQAELTISAYRKFIDRGTPIILSFEESDIFKPMCEKDETPMLILPQSTFAMYPAGWLYGVFPPQSENFAVWCEWILENWKEAEAPKVAVMGTDILTTNSLLEANNYVENIGIEMLPTEYVPWAPLDTTPQLLRLNERGVDYIFISPLSVTAIPILKDADRLGLIGTIQFGAIDYAQSETLVKALGPTADGYSSPRTCPWWNEIEIPGIKLMQNLRKDYGIKYAFEGPDAHGLTLMAVTCEAIKRAIGNVGYENLDGPAVKEALDNMKDYDIYGIKKITYTPDDHRGSAAVRIYQVKDGNVVPVSDFKEAPVIMPES